ncbi:GspH/FimT family pseudopilin [Dasania marina]|uniref:GspH/FimT family pseudopilin n=1 Tax=Dasania marina TaxID=471499 RepID=UPI0014616A31|nr:GspH/FimT family pseudopilin [Dasania marina]
MKSISLGFTLSNILFSLAVLSILLMVTAPSLSHMLDKQRSTVVINKLSKLIYLTRQQAISANAYTTICPSIDLVTCVDDWNQQLILFTDYDKNEKVNGDDTIFRVSDLIPDGFGNLNLRTSGNKYLQFNARGYTNGKWGNITYCPSNRDLTLARRIVINRTGRIRHEKDINGDGIIDTSTPLLCN